MTTKEFLNQAYVASCDVELSRRKLEALGKMHDGATDDESADKLGEAQARLNAEINRLLDIWLQVEDTICQVKNPTHRDILSRRYLLFQPWTVISAETRFDKRYVFRIHKKAITALASKKED